MNECSGMNLHFHGDCFPYYYLSLRQCESAAAPAAALRVHLPLGGGELADAGCVQLSALPC